MNMNFEQTTNYTFNDLNEMFHMMCDCCSYFYYCNLLFVNGATGTCLLNACFLRRGCWDSNILCLHISKYIDNAMCIIDLRIQNRRMAKASSIVVGMVSRKVLIAHHWSYKDEVLPNNLECGLRVIHTRSYENKIGNKFRIYERKDTINNARLPWYWQCSAWIDSVFFASLYPFN